MGMSPQEVLQGLDWAFEIVKMDERMSWKISNSIVEIGMWDGNSSEKWNLETSMVSESYEIRWLKWSAEEKKNIFEVLLL